MTLLRPTMCALWVVAAPPAAAATAGPSWVEIGGNARVEFAALPLPAETPLAPGARCSAWVAVTADDLTVGEVPEDADRRVSRVCDPDVLAVAQAAAPGWRLPVRSWTPIDAVPVPITFVIDDRGAVRAQVEVVSERYGVSPDAHPPALDLVESARLQRAPEPRFPRSARKHVRDGSLPDRVACGLELGIGVDGRVTQVVVSDCPDPLVDAVTALGRAYRFSPRVVNGAPVASSLPLSVQLRAD